MWKRENPAAIMVSLAAAGMAFNINCFVNAVGLYPGGFNGIALLVQRAGDSFFHIAIAFSLISYPLNILALVLSYRSLGKRFLIYTILSVGLTGILTDMMPAFPLTDDVLLASILRRHHQRCMHKHIHAGRRLHRGHGHPGQRIRSPAEQRPLEHHSGSQYSDTSGRRSALWLG